MRSTLKNGAIKGGLNDRNDPNYTKREQVANHLYKQIRNRKANYEIEAVAEHSGMPKEDVERVYNHIFIREHNLGDGRIDVFDPDYYMAHSWIRLRNGKGIQEHDMILLQHELAEEKIMGNSLDVLYEEAHNIAEKQYSYKRALLEYLRNHDV